MWRTAKWAVSGMTCAACVGRVEKAIGKLSGVREASVHLMLEQAYVTFDDELLDEAKITAAIGGSGYGAQLLGASEGSGGSLTGADAAVTSIPSFKVKRELIVVTQPSAVQPVVGEQGVMQVESGVSEAEEGQQQAPKQASQQVAEQASKQSPQSASSDLLWRQQEAQKARQQAELDRQRRLAVICLLLSVPFIPAMIGMFVSEWHWLHEPVLQFVLATVIQLVGGRGFYRGAYFALKQKTANMDVLVVLGTTAAYLYSCVSLLRGATEQIYFESSALVITFVLLGKWLELRARRQMSGAISGLLALQPRTARLLVSDGGHRDVSIDQLQPGDRLLVKAGETVPADGEVLVGEGALDESMLSGESMPRQKTAGATVYAGSLNRAGAFELRVSKRADETLLAQLMAAVERAQSTKAPIQKLADRISAQFTWLIIAVAMSAGATWYIALAPGDLNRALLVAVSVLVVACPCALGLATPSALVAGMGRAAQRGVLFRDGDALQKLARVSRLAFDKTGTLTEGRPTLQALIVSQEARAKAIDERTLFSLIASVESMSEHPLARAVIEKAGADAIHYERPDSYEAESGRSVRGVVAGRTVTITAAEHARHADKQFAANGHQRWPSDLLDAYEKLAADAATVSLVALDGRPMALLVFTDRPKTDATSALQALRKAGLEIHLLTGDRKPAARAMARQTGNQIVDEHIHADLLPLDKLEWIERRRASNQFVAMIGDGINDAAALAAADVGIVVHNGTDLARHAGSVFIMRHELYAVHDAIHLARRTMTTIRQNLFWAFAFNAVMIPLAFSGLLTPWMAGAAMAASSLFVIANALRLRVV